MKGDSLVLAEAMERIRELEAELAKLKGDIHKDAAELRCPKCGEWTNRTHWTIRPGDSLKARAEEAECIVAAQVKLLQQAYEESQEVLGIRRVLEARVAGLTELLIGAHAGGPEWERKVADAIYDREREAE